MHLKDIAVSYFEKKVKGSLVDQDGQAAYRRLLDGF